MPKNHRAESDLNILSDQNEDSISGMNLVNDMVRFRQHPVKFMDTIRKFYLGSSWRSYDPYVGARLYSTHFRDRILEETLHHALLQKTIRSLVDRRMETEKTWQWSPNELEDRRKLYTKWVNDMATEIAVKAMPTFENVSNVKLLYYIVAQMLSRCYHQGVHISNADVKRVVSRAKELQAKKQSLLLFPCHKSHMDYITLVFAFFRLGLSLPATIAGDNLDIPLVNRYLREVGATYIRRGDWSIDPLYQTFFQSLIDVYLQEGVNFQCFIEGTRSRTGKLLPPKFGILKYCLESILSGSVEDAWVLPISTQYDKVVEADQYAIELLGREKTKESIWSFMESREVFSLRLGRVDVKFGDIWSLKEFCIDSLQQLQIELGPGKSFPLAQKLESKTLNYVLKSLGYRILEDINKASVVMPSALVGTILLTTRSKGLSHNEICRRVKELIQLVIGAGGRIGALNKTPTDLTAADISALVDNAVSVLGSDLITVQDKGLLEPVYHINDEFKLSYYRNQIVHLFVSEAIVCVALYSLWKESLRLQIPKRKLEERVKFLSVVLAGEFVYRSEGLTSNYEQTIGKLASQGVIRVNDAKDAIDICLGTDETEMTLMDFYCYLVWPFIDGYASVALSLFILPNGGPIKEKDFYKMAQGVARTLYAQGELVHPEALNQEIIRFATAHYDVRGVVKRYKDAAKVGWLTITPEYMPQTDSATGKLLLKGPLYNLAQEMSLCRDKPVRYSRSQTITRRALEICLPVAQSLQTQPRPRM